MFFAADKVFDKSGDVFIHADQISTISNHKGVGDPSSIRHLRAAHTLLSYIPNTTSFIKTTLGSHWVGGKEPDWSMQHKLFKKFNILSDRILKEDRLRASWRTSGKDSGVRIQEPSADQIIVSDVPVARPIRQFRGQAIEISDPESEGHP